MWTEGVEMAKTARALNEAITSGKPERVEELAKLLSGQVRNEVERQAELEGWYEEYEQATDHEHWEVETTVDPYGSVAFPVCVVPAKGGSSTPFFDDGDLDMIERGLEHGIIQVEPDGNTDIRVSVGEYCFWAKMPEELGPHADRHFSDIAACDFTDAIASALADMAEDHEGYGGEYTYCDVFFDAIASALADIAEDPECYESERAYCDAHLHENVDLTANESSEPISLKGEALASRDAAAALCANDGIRAAVSQQR